MITLITGVPGHGKTQKAIQLLLACIEDNKKRAKKGEPERPIFCNIAGVNGDGATPLPTVEPIPTSKIFLGSTNDPLLTCPPDFWQPPTGSIFFFDECQRVDWLKQSHGALSKDIRTQALETHRHEGYDLYLVCQGAQYLHTHVQSLVAPHFHCERPLNLPFTNVFFHNTFVPNPTTNAAKKNCDVRTSLKLGKKFGQYYKSSSQHNMKKVIPPKMVMAVVGLLIMFGYLYTRFQSDPLFNQSSDTPSEELQQKIDQQLAQSQQAQPAGYHYKYVDYSENEDMRPAMIIRTETTCYARNAQGVPLDLDLDTCNFYSDNQQFIPRSSIPYEKPEDQKTEKVNQI